jgi:hypothetical protein
MSYETYKLLHFFGIFLFLLLFGARIAHAQAGGAKGGHPAHRLITIGHGVALVIIFVAGFGMHARLQIDGFPGWFLAKIGLWLVLGGLFALPYRSPERSNLLWAAVPVLAGASAWLALSKPF